MTSAEELAFKPAAEVLELYRRRELAPSEYLQALFVRIDDDANHSEPINGFSELLREEALAEAKQADEAFATGQLRGDQPLLGLPVAVKEKHAIAGRTFTQGMRAHANHVATADHPIVRRIRSAGALIHGRTTSSEFSCATFTHTSLWGVTRNPWDRQLTPGGSSGGAGAVLAAGFAPLATASDIAGSTRIPAGFTGTVGYKGPYGTVPGAGPLAADWYRGDGAMARTVEDTALLTNVIRGVDPGDHGSVPSAAAHPQARSQAVESLAGRRLVYAPTLGDYPVQRKVRAQVDAAVERFEAAGATVEIVELPWTTAHIRETTMAHFGHILAEGMRRALAGYEETAEDYTRRFIEVATQYSRRISLFETLEAEQQIQADVLDAIGDADALISPVSAIRGLQADGRYLEGITVDDQPDGGTVVLEHYWEAHMTVPFNVANRCPVLAVPAGMDDGFPIGMQIVGRPFDESTVFEIAQAWQEISPLPTLTDLS
ncbi:amidase [Nesterenkonia haasae]|uniref:amidase n=1 Tax=Nesterenkonia haasae TaxID=2587813 RepID=UPI001390F3FC|nr:amidase [Nesterenkonia haasae]NDK32491.1 amidase [Nesterenkonia haasae]